MRRIQLSLITLLCANCSWGQERPDKIYDVSGVWHSTTGATVRVLPYAYAPRLKLPQSLAYGRSEAAPLRRRGGGAIYGTIRGGYSPAATRQTFVIVAEVRKGHPLRYQAEWLAGFRQQFRYLTSDGDEIMGVVDLDGSNVQLGNGRGWKAWWRR